MIELVGSRKEQLELVSASKPVDTQYFYDEGFKAGVDSVPRLEEQALSFQLSNFNVFKSEEATLSLYSANTLHNLVYARGSANQNTTVKHFTLNVKGQPKGLQYMLATDGYANDYILTKVVFNVDTSKTTTNYGAFSGLRALEIIEGTPINLTSATDVRSFFGNCEALREVRFAEGTIYLSFEMGQSANLSNDTIESLIAGLATVETQQTLTLHADVKAKLTDTQKATIATKNWLLA